MECQSPSDQHLENARRAGFCLARLAVICQQRGGLLETARAKTALYCRDCAPIVRRNQSAKYKRDLRSKLGWRKYKEEYLPYTEEQGRKNHSVYMKKWRARKKQLEAAQIWTESDVNLAMEKGTAAISGTGDKHSQSTGDQH